MFTRSSGRRKPTKTYRRLVSMKDTVKGGLYRARPVGDCTVVFMDDMGDTRFVYHNTMVRMPWYYRPLCELQAFWRALWRE